MDTSDLSHHISRRFNEDLERVRSKVLAMGGFVEQQSGRRADVCCVGSAWPCFGRQPCYGSNEAPCIRFGSTRMRKRGQSR
jgi:hypothetical protein